MHTEHTPSVDFRLGIELTPDRPITRLVELAEQSEAAGFDVIFLSHHFNNRDPAVALGRLAGATDRVAIGPGVFNPYDIHPARIASQLASLDELTDGRAICGLGAGDPSTLQLLGIEQAAPARCVHETISVLRRLWNGEHVTHDGAFSLDGAALNFQSRPIPIVVGAQGPSMLRLAAAHGDGVLLNAAHPRDYRWATTHIDRGRERRPADATPLTVAGFVSVSVSTDAAAATAAARPPVAFITAGAPVETCRRHGLEETAVEGVRDALRAGDRTTAYERVTPRMLDAFCVAGTPEEVSAQLAKIGAFTDALVLGSPLGPDPAEAVELLGDVDTRLEEVGVWAT